MTTNLLTVLAVTWNEEAIIGDFIDWYRTAIPECTIVIYDNCSTDATAAIALRKGCEVRFFDTANTYDEQSLVDIRNHRWKDYSSSYCCVVDADEWVAVTREFLVASLKMGWGFHYSLPDATHREYFTAGYRQRLRVV
jgi:glycosyltransferase involved in cell wall biosynthesis